MNWTTKDLNTEHAIREKIAKAQKTLDKQSMLLSKLYDKVYKENKGVTASTSHNS